MLHLANMMTANASTLMLSLSRSERNVQRSQEKAWDLEHMSLTERMESQSQRRLILTWDNLLLGPSLLQEAEMLMLHLDNMTTENVLMITLSPSRSEKSELKSLKKEWVQVLMSPIEQMALQSLRCQISTWVARQLDHNLLQKEEMLMLPQANMMMESALMMELNPSRLVRSALKSLETVWVLALMNLIEQTE